MFINPNLDLSFLPKKARVIAESDRSIALYWQQEIKKLPLPKNYIPFTVEIRIDNELVVTIAASENIARLTEEKLKSLAAPSVLDIRFDNECVFLKAEGQIIINRLLEKE